jgi:alkylhydroperoxidase family enzyme
LIAILQDPELLTTLTDPTNIYKVLERHPCLLEAATHLSASFHEENSNSQSSASLLGRGSLSYNYSLDLMSDDEYMSETESPAEPQQQQQQPNAREVANLLVQAFRSNPRSASQSTSQGVITQGFILLILSIYFNNLIQNI